MKNIDIKVGDLVYCYKNSYAGGIICNQEGKNYKIERINSYDTYYSIIINCENYYGLIYYIADFEVDNSIPLFYDFFMSKKEYRKLKFKNLNEQF